MWRNLSLFGRREARRTQVPWLWLQGVNSHGRPVESIRPQLIHCLLLRRLSFVDWVLLVKKCQVTALSLLPKPQRWVTELAREGRLTPNRAPDPDTCKMSGRQNVRLPPEVNRALYVRNLPFQISSEEMYDIFGKYGAIRQIRLGNSPTTRGTAFVVYEDIYDAKNAVDHLSGFNVCKRYLVVLYYQPKRMQKRQENKKRRLELEHLKARFGLK